MSDKKIKIFTLSDHPLTPSGVGTQTRYIIEGMLRTGKYQFISFGGLIKHQDYRPIKTDEFGDDWVIIPTDGYGTQESIRAMLWAEKSTQLEPATLVEEINGGDASGVRSGVVGDQANS